MLIVKKNQDGFLEFLNVTRVPYERKLIDLNLLSSQEIEYINKYHELVVLKYIVIIIKVLKELVPILEKQNDIRAIKWLNEKCSKL
jgi:Xaa-Pro aminopeptidase